jgi:hypothetical protein
MQERNPIRFDLTVPERPFAFLPDALPEAEGTVTVAAGEGVDDLSIELRGLPGDAAYTIFLAESGAPPFGAIQYLADLATDADGSAAIDLRTAALNAFALRGVASDGRLDPAATNETRVALDHVVVWPKDPATTADLFAAEDQEPVATPFDDDGEAGPAVLTTARGEAAGPLAAAASEAEGAAATVLVGENAELVGGRCPQIVDRDMEACQAVLGQHLAGEGGLGQRQHRFDAVVSKLGQIGVEGRQQRRVVRRRVPAPASRPTAAR